MFDLSIPRRMYYSDRCGLVICPECNSELIEERCAIMLYVKSDIDEANFMTSLHGSRFCAHCPVVVFDIELVEKAATLGIKGEEKIEYGIIGMVDLDSVPEEKRALELGTDENPVPIVYFLPDLNTTTVKNEEKIGRNAPCPCGSGKKYKKCCGR